MIRKLAGEDASNLHTKKTSSKNQVVCLVAVCFFLFHERIGFGSLFTSYSNLHITRPFENCTLQSLGLLHKLGDFLHNSQAAEEAIRPPEPKLDRCHSIARRSSGSEFPKKKDTFSQKTYKALCCTRGDTLLT